MRSTRVEEQTITPPASQPPASVAEPGQAQRLRMSYEEYLAWADEDVHAEWVNGEVIVQMPPKLRHQRVVKFLLKLLDLFAELSQLGTVPCAPFEMRATPDCPALEPDLLFVAREYQE